MRRYGMTYRIHDFGPLTVGLDPEHRGGLFSPVVFALFRYTRKRKDMESWSPGCEYVTTYHRLDIPLPFPKWYIAYRLRRLGVLRVYYFFQRLVYRLAK